MIAERNQDLHYLAYYYEGGCVRLPINLSCLQEVGGRWGSIPIKPYTKARLPCITEVAEGEGLDILTDILHKSGKHLSQCRNLVSKWTPHTGNLCLINWFHSWRRSVWCLVTDLHIESFIPQRLHYVKYMMIW